MMSPQVKYRLYKHISSNVGIVTYLCDLYGVFCLGARDYTVGIPVLAFSMVVSVKANYIYWWLMERLASGEDKGP